MRRLIGTAAILALLATACVQDPSVPDDEANILQLVASSSYARMQPLDGEGEGGGRSVEMPEFWYRTVISEGALNLVFENDPSTGVCTLTVIRAMHGQFNIDVVHDGQNDPGTKSIEDVRTRRLIVERLEETTEPHGGWVLTQITPAEFALDSGLPQEVFVQSMALYAGDDLLWECDSQDSFYSIEDGLPLLVPGTMVRLESEVLHTNPMFEPELFVFAHGPCPTWPRHLMNDDGLFGDRSAGDGIYSYEWYVEASSDHWFIAVDVIDADTMNDQVEEDYDSGAWGILAVRN